MSSTSKGPTTPFFVAYGDEDFFLDRVISWARSWPNRNITYLDASDKLDDQMLLQELETQDIEDKGRTIILDEAQKLKETKIKAFRQYVENWPNTNTSVALVAIVRSDKLNDLWSTVGTKGRIVEHKKFKPWPDKTGRTEHQKWAETEAKRIGLVFEPGVIDTLCQMTANDLYRIQSELRKLNLLVEPGTKVSNKHLASIIAVTATSEPKDVVEAAFNKNLKGAMNHLSTTYKAMGDEASIVLAYALMRETKKTLTASHMLARGRTEDEIAAALSMNPWRCRTFFLPMVKKHSEASLIKLMSRLCKLDQDVKSASHSKRTLVELTVLSIAR